MYIMPVASTQNKPIKFSSPSSKGFSANVTSNNHPQQEKVPSHPCQRNYVLFGGSLPKVALKASRKALSSVKRKGVHTQKKMGRPPKYPATIANFKKKLETDKKFREEIIENTAAGNSKRSFLRRTYIEEAQEKNLSLPKELDLKKEWNSHNKNVNRLHPDFRPSDLEFRPSNFKPAHPGAKGISDYPDYKFEVEDGIAPKTKPSSVPHVK